MPYFRGDPGDGALVKAAFAQVPMGVVVLDREFRYVAINEELARSNGLPVRDHIGRTVAEVIPDQWPMLEPLFDRVMKGETVHETWTDIWIEHSRAFRSARAMFVPIRVPGADEVAGIVVAFQDVSEEVRLRQRGERLRELAAALAGAQSREDVAHQVYDVAAKELGSTALLLCSVDTASGLLETLGVGTDDSVSAQYAQLPLSFDCPPTAVVTSRRALLIRDRAEHDERWPHGASAAAANGVESSATIPVIDGGEVIGAMGLGWQEPRDFGADEVGYLNALSRCAFDAVQRVITRERDIATAARAEALLRVASTLNSLVDAKEVASLISDTILKLSEAKEAGVFVDDGSGDLVRLGVSGALDIDLRERRTTIPAHARYPVNQVVESLRPLWLEQRHDWADFPELHADLEALGWPTTAVLPLTVGADGGSERAMGALYANFHSHRQLQGEERRFMQTVSELATSALQRIRAADAETAVRAALALSESRLAVLADSSAIGVLEATETHVVKANDAFLRMLGYDHLPEGGLDWRELTPPEWAGADEQALKEMAETGACQPFEKEYYRADSTRVPVLLSVAVIRDDPLEAIATVTDLSARKERERRERESMRARERLSRAIQTALFPRLSTEASGYRVRVGYRPGDDRMALGGDFYDALVLPDGSLAAVIGDVTGHGPVAAATGAGLRAAWRAAMINGVPLLEVPGLLERVLLSERESDLSFATALMGLLRPEGRADLIACGHPPPLKISSGSADEVPLPAHVMLGIEPNRGVDVTSIELATEDRLLLYTDGLVEGRAAPGSPERLGPEGVASILDGMADVDPDELIDTVMTRHGGGLRDDVAVLVLGPRATA